MCLQVKRRLSGKAMPRLLIFYHYFHPDDVVSAHHYSQLAGELQARGWYVMAMPANRGRHNESQVFEPYEYWGGVEIRRIGRPRFSQTSTLGRGLNALWMIFAWSLVAFRKKSVSDIDVVLVGTDPILSVLVSIVWKLVRPRTKVAHWCFDLFPETAIAAGIFRPNVFWVRIFKIFLKRAYKACNLIVDTGGCQRARLQAYDKSIGQATCTPWSLFEPPQPVPIDIHEREELFGNAKLALFYSGNIGVAYSYERFLKLARRLRGEDIKFVFSVRGKRVEELKKDVSAEDTNISFASFAPIDRLQARLSAPDIHLASLREEFTGTLVPSKFFGSLAVGRPVIFDGSMDSAVSDWIKTYQLGWVLTPKTLDSVADDLVRLSNSPQDLEELRQRCHRVYQEVFSKKQVMDTWDEELRKLLCSI